MNDNEHVHPTMRPALEAIESMHRCTLAAMDCIMTGRPLNECLADQEPRLRAALKMDPIERQAADGSAEYFCRRCDYPMGRDQGRLGLCIGCPQAVAE
jgi:hypothetical protein